MNVDRIVFVGCVVLAAVAVIVIPDERAAEQEAPEQQPAKSLGVVTASAAPSLDCLRLVRGQWLYGAILHTGDKMHQSECFYGHGGKRFVQ